MLEGEAGFYHAYAGNNRGELRYSLPARTAPTSGDHRGARSRLDVPRNAVPGLFDAGYNIAHVDVTAKLCEEHNITYDRDRPDRGGRQLDGDRIPEPGLSDPEPRPRAAPGGRQHALFHGLRRRDSRLPDAASGDPRPRRERPARGARPDAARDLDPGVGRTLFGPRITVFTKDGRSHTREGTGREFIWDFEEKARRIRPIAPGIAIGEAQFDRLIDSCRHLDAVDRAAETLIGLTIPA